MTAMHIPANNTALRAHMQQVHTEAAGVMYFDVVRRRDMPRMLGAALAGDVEAAHLFRLVQQALDGIAGAAPGQERLCATCPRKLTGNRFAIVVATPACDDPTAGFALGICHRCGHTTPALKAQAMRAFKKFWPDARPLTVTHPEGGRA